MVLWKHCLGFCEIKVVKKMFSSFHEIFMPQKIPRMVPVPKFKKSCSFSYLVYLNVFIHTHQGWKIKIIKLQVSSLVPKL